MTDRPLHVIGREIVADWNKPYFAAIPYINAICRLNTIDDRYGMESADTIVIRFLINARTWRGETARRIKAELRGMI